jgi:hypothetical protein
MTGDLIDSVVDADVVRDGKLLQVSLRPVELEV